MSDLAIIETLNAVDLFENDTAKKLVSDLCKEYRANVYDISNEEGRKSLADDAKLINKWSNGLDGLGKAHVAVLKSKPKLIDSERKKMRDSLAALHTEVLKPLTDWKNEEKERVDSIQASINDMRVSSCGVMSDRVTNLDDSKAFMLEISNTVIDDSFDEFKGQAERQKEESLLMLSGIIARFMTEQADAEKAAKLQADAEAKVKQEREEQIRVEATKAAELKAEQEKKEILAREQKAIDDATQAERDKIAAQERAKVEQEQAVQAEKDKAAKAKQDSIDAEAARKRNTQHKGKINRETRDALISLSLPQHEISAVQAELIVALIAKGKIPNVSIKY